jgi:RimJ/RimL family protein N-acetyltransferase
MIKTDLSNTNCDKPNKPRLDGQYTYLEILDSHKHSQGLYRALCEQSNHSIWQYLPTGPFKKYEQFISWLKDLSEQNIVYVIFNKNNHQITGLICYLNVDISHKSVEIGWVIYSKPIQKTRVGTEVMYLLMQYVFDLGYRRLVWKCDQLNKKSAAAALRFGFKPEGVFRNHWIMKGRNRNTAWFSVLNMEWPNLSLNFNRWLHSENFDNCGKQYNKLNLMGEVA